MEHILEKPNTIPWPPIIVALSIFVGMLLHQFYPLPWLRGIAADLSFAFGVILGAIAIALTISTIKTLAKNHTTVHPTKAADKLVTTGPFAFSRNPIYLANVCIIIAIGLVFGSLWLLAAACAAAFATKKLAIEREEAHLQHKFGKAWHTYKKKARRWF